MKDKKEILEKLKDDEHYYGEFGRNFISNSDIRTLMTNPLDLNSFLTFLSEVTSILLFLNQTRSRILKL
jgi:hypothetical protein